MANIDNNPNPQNPLQVDMENAAKDAEKAVKKSNLPDFVKTRPFIITAVLVLILIISIAIILINRGKPIAPGSSKDELLVVVGSREIYRSTVEQEALKQYGQVPTDKTALKSVLSTMIERTILDNEAFSKGIKVEATESAAKVKSYLGNSNTNVTSAIEQKARYDILKEKIMKQYVNSRTAQTVNFWTADEEYAQLELDEAGRQEALKQQQEGRLALLQIADLIRRGVDPVSAARQIMTNAQFSTVKKIIAINGYILEENDNDDLMNTPKVYTSADESAIGKFFYDSLFSTRKDEVRSFLSSEGNAGYVIKVIEANDSPYRTYNEWLGARLTETAKYHNPL